MSCLFLLLNAHHLEEVAYGIYRATYTALAKQIIKDTGVRQGVLVDVGCGHGYVGWELAKREKFFVYGVDIDPKAVEWARRNAEREGLEGRAAVLLGDALDLPFGENFADLVVSRGMAPFMSREDRIQVYREAWRVLKPGGVAYIGGGFSRYLPPKLMKEIARGKGWKEGQPASCYIPPERLAQELREAGIEKFRILVDHYPEAPYGAWVMFRKPRGKPLKAGLLFKEEFEGLREGRAPQGWTFPLGGGWTVVKVGDKKVLEHRGPGESIALAKKKEWADCVIRADIQLGEKEVGGVVACWRPDIGGYCLRVVRERSGLELVRVRGRISQHKVLQSVPVRLKEGRWWELKIEVTTAGHKVRVRGKLWPKGQPEPPKWNIEAEEGLERRSLSGLAGLWASPEGHPYRGVRFDDFAVLSVRKGR